MCFELVEDTVAEVLGAQDHQLVDVVGGQPPFGIDPPDLDAVPLEALDPLPERAQDRPDDLGVRPQAGNDADGQHARLPDRELPDRPDRGDVIVAVDDHRDRCGHGAVPSWEIAVRAISLVIRSAPSWRQSSLAVSVNAAQERSRPLAALSLIRISSSGSIPA